MQETLADEVIKIAGKLIQYIRHTSNCEYEMEHHDTCVCGVSALAREYDEKLKKYNESLQK
jgi:hypothetical protein